MTMLQHIRMGKVVPGIADVDNDVAMAYVPANAHARVGLFGAVMQYSGAVAAAKATVLKTINDPDVDGLLNAPTLSIGSTDTKVKTTAFHYLISRSAYAKAAVAAGSTLATGTIPANKWGVYRFVIASDGTIDCLAGAANFTTGYDNEAAAIAALPAVPADHIGAGYFTVLTAVGSAFVGGTDALQGGAAGNPSSDTNYYSGTVVGLTNVVTLYRRLFTYGGISFVMPLPWWSDYGQAFLLVLDASGTGGITGEVHAYVAGP